MSNLSFINAKIPAMLHSYWVKKNGVLFSWSDAMHRPHNVIFSLLPPVTWVVQPIADVFNHGIVRMIVWLVINISTHDPNKLKHIFY